LYFFSAYGYVVRSEINIPGLVRVSEGKYNISILKQISQNSGSSIKNTIFIRNTANGLKIYWPGVATYLIERDSNITVTCTFLSQESPLQIQPLYGIVLAAILQFKNCFVLHGSTVEVDGESLVVVGRKGIGKSTITASLLNHGCNFIADDVTALQMGQDSMVHVLPGVPRLKLWSDAAQALGYDTADLPLVAPSIAKHLLMVPEHQFCNKKIPLGGIVMMDHGNTLEMHELRETEKMIWLAGGQYFAKYQQQLPDDIRRNNFSFCSYLARRGRIVRVVVPRNLTELSCLMELLKEVVKGKQPVG
jgi:hypothetical protein